ncbi:hypothetical protein ANCCAN_18751 [Ancylostoma caninum]|uniref:Uncharacterized protein n=1 Tax=Ancylostoma caninum TaxID=29170 RepID=A0A368FT36_ANCCA|nr:hypothetical protein ANCCAN_18751 [Ancylostoma caninum]
MDDDAIKILDQIHEVLSTKAPEAVPLLDKFVSKFPSLSAEIVEAEKRPRSVVIYGVPEADSKLSATSRQAHTENFVSGILDALDVEMRPVELSRMGRTVCVTYPAKNVYVRKSMTTEEREEYRDAKNHA